MSGISADARTPSSLDDIVNMEASKSAIPLGRALLFVFIATVGCAADLLTKYWIFTWPDLDGGNIYWLWPEHAGFQRSLNEGALFGFGQGMVWLFAAVSIVAAIAIPVWLFVVGAAADRWLNLALGCVMAGVLGNLYDRLGLPALKWMPPHPRAGETVYAVRDWILLQWNDRWVWPNFNIADALLVTGTCLLLWHAYGHTERKPPSRETASHGAPG